MQKILESRVVESRAVKLLDLFRDVRDVEFVGDPSSDIASLAYHTSEVAPGSLFFCVPGFLRDGHDFAETAVSSGAAALCVERPLDVPVPQAVVPSVRHAMGIVASLLHEHPSARLAVVGITGTNGKTTSAFLTAYLLDRAGRRSGLLGTIERRIGGVSLPAGRTTPEAIDIQQDLALMVDSGDQAAVMEVSSHALALKRLNGTVFAAVAFTNLTQDHLDFHTGLEDYFSAKSSLFLDPQFVRNRPPAVVNIDDPFGRVLVERLPSDRLLTFSAGGMVPAAPDPSDGSGVGKADVEATEIEMGEAGTRFTLILRGRALAHVRRLEGLFVERGEEARHVVRSPLVGRFNVANVVTALGLGIGLGLDLDLMIAAIPRFPGVPGRMERVGQGAPFTVLVDYAHTPDSVANALRAARDAEPERIIAVVGCGGDRDRGKRPLMGRAAEEAADQVVVTSDNPRSEDPQAIIDDIVAGLEWPERALVEVDRRTGIRAAFEQACPGDVVLILGKGHESGQEFADRVTPFDDRRVAEELLEELSKEHQ